MVSRIVFSEITAEVRSGSSALNMAQAKELLGWTEETPEENWGKDFHVLDSFGKKIRLKNNPNNRPIKKPLYTRYKLVFLNRNFELNGEPVIVNRLAQINDGQHRLIGFVLAEQERGIDQRKYGAQELSYSTIVVYGISEKKEVVDKTNTGKARSLGDVFYRREKFSSSLSDKDIRRICNTLGEAVRLVWLRSGGQKVSGSPRFEHDVATAFRDSHPDIRKSVEYMVELNNGDGNENLIASLVSLGTSSAMHYLMADVSKPKADLFWELMASGIGLESGSPILALRKYLTSIDASSGPQRDAIIGSIVKAWLAYISDTSLTVAKVKVKRTKDDAGKFKFAEFPRIGGIDSETETEEELGLNSKIVLSTLCDSNDSSLTFQQISDLSSLPKSKISRVCNSETPPNLSDSGFIKLQTLENENGENFVAVSITPAGRREVR